ncbi:hypothetical protein BDV26DRAFT_284245 [Aspergillus bertholletiae]|uniref:Uncharacterized protein n=1 Tax=Aspergillus bertholletiae TaxID=1226010 RepID=A0A5N7AZF0_9EURO|nr:hypothetical protein BDV26DRAFT_284245 [Aspergillus bertholletiae]
MALDQIPRIIGFQILCSLNLLIFSLNANNVFDLHISGALFYIYVIDMVINSLHANYTRIPDYYYLSHVVAIMLILESERLHATNQSTADFVNGNINNQPTTRSLARASSFLYHTGGLRMFLNGLQAGLVYHIVHFVLTGLLQMVLFRHVLLRPIAQILSTRAWGKLLIPSLVCSAAHAAIEYLPGAADSSFDLFFKDASPYYIAYFEVSTMLPTLVLRMIAVLPASVALVLVEASFLPETETTIVPSTHDRRARMSTFFWLWELHAKRCLLQSVIDIVIMWLEGGFD